MRAISSGSMYYGLLFRERMPTVCVDRLGKVRSLEYPSSFSIQRRTKLAERSFREKRWNEKKPTAAPLDSAYQKETESKRRRIEDTDC